MKQYMPAKPFRYGIKVLMSCDANTAYLSNFKVYLASGYRHAVVLRLIERLFSSFRHIYLNNFLVEFHLCLLCWEMDCIVMVL